MSFQIKGLPIEDSAIQLLAYRIYCEGGGSSLENWLEAERMLNNKNQEGFAFIDVGNKD